MADINIFKDDTLVSGTGNADFFQNQGKNVTINAGAGDDTVSSFGDNALINGEDGNDNLYLWGGSGSTVNSGAGNDQVLINTDNAIVNTENGDDVITFQKGENIAVNSGIGDDVINVQKGENITVNSEAGNDLIKIFNGNLVSVNGGANNDEIHIYNGDNISVNGDSGNDQIVIYGDVTGNVTINTGNGEDTVSLWNASTTFIQSGAGNNTVRFMTNSNIHVSALDNSSITLDMAQGKQSKATLEGNTAGNYTLGGTSNGDVFDIKQGNAVITNYDTADTIKISEDIIKTENIGNDVKLITDSSSVLVKNGGAHYLKVQEGSNDLDNKIYGSNYKKGYSPQDVIKKFMLSFATTTKSGTAALNEAIQAAIGDSNMTVSKLIEQLISDAKNNPNFLEEYCGILLGNSDTGALTGWDTGMSSEPIIEDALIPNNGPYSTIAAGSSETIDGYGLIVNYPSVGANGSTITETEQQLINGLHSWWIKESLKLFFETYGDIFTVNGKSLDIVFKNEANGAPASAGARSATQMVYNYNMYGKEGNLNIYDIHDGIALPHELTHAIMGTTNLGKLGTLPHFIVEGIAIVAGGMEGSAWEPTIKDLANDPDRLRTALDITSTTLISDNYPAGYIFFRYLSKRYSQLEPVIIDTDDTNVIRIDSDNKSYTGTSNADSIYSSDYLRYKNITITGGSNNDSIGSDLGIVRIYNSKVDGGGGSDVMYLNAVKSSVNGGAGNDTVRIDMSFSTVDGGAGNDWIVSNGFGGNAGFNYINGGAGNDTIGANEFKFRLSGTVNGGDGNDLIYVDFATVNCGAGDDTINAYRGESVIQYKKGDGNDVIQNYYSGYNSINIVDGEIDGFTTAGDDLILKVGDGSITFKNIKTTDFTNPNTINIQYSNSTLEPFIYDGKDTLKATYDYTRHSTEFPQVPTVSGTSDNDYIFDYSTSGLFGDRYIVNLSKGDDIFVANTNHQNEFRYSTGDGDDIIYFANNYDFDYWGSYIALDKDSTVSAITGNGNDIILKIGNGSITLKDFKNNLIRIAHFDTEKIEYSGVDYEYPYAYDFKGFYFDGKNTLSAIYEVTETDDDDSYDSIIGTEGNDIIYNLYGYSGDLVYGKNGNDLIKNQFNGSTTIDAGAGNDTIDNLSYVQETSVNGGVGADIFTGSYTNSTIIGGKGNDTLNGSYSNSIIQYTDGDGNDVILNYGQEGYNIPNMGNATIKITEGKINSAKAKNNDAVISIGQGGITVKDVQNQVIVVQDVNDSPHYYYHNGSNVSEITTANSESSVEINGTDNGDLIYSYNSRGISYQTIKSGAGNDTILTNTNYSLIDAGEGNNFVKSSGYMSTVITGNGNNTISNIETILAGNGNDSISGGYLIRAGKGNDTIVNTSQQIIQYAEGDGNDVVSVSGSLNGKIELLDGASVTSYKVNGTTHTIKIGTGSITLKNAGSFVNIVSDNTDTMYMDGHVFNNKMNVNQQNFTDEYDLEHVTSITIDGTVSDDYVNNSENAPSTINTDAGDDYIKNAADYSKIYSGDGNDTIIDSSAHTTISGGDGDDFIQVGGSGSETLFNYTYSNDVEEKHIDFTDSAPAANSVSGGSGNDIIEVNAYYTRYTYSNPLTYGSEAFIGQRITITGGTGDDTILNSLNDLCNYQDDYMTISSVAIYDRLIQYADGDGNDVIEDYHSTDTIQVIDSDYSTTTSGNDVIITVGEGSIKLLNAKGTDLNIVTVKSSVDLKSVTLSNSDASIYIAESDIGTIDASKRTKGIYITGNKYNNLIKGGKGSDTLVGGAGDDIITTGNGKDTIIYSGGNDTITDYKAGSDVIQLASNVSVTSSTIDGTTLTFNTNQGTLTVLNGSKSNKKGVITGNKITMVNADGMKVSRIFGLNSLTVSTGDGDSLDFSADIVADVEVINASSRTSKKPIEIIGNSKDNSIKGGKGADTISGGYVVVTNDTLTGGSGNDVFVYQSGRDVITDYTVTKKATDVIRLNLASGLDTAKAEDYYLVGKDLVIPFGNDTLNSITIVNGKDKIITFEDSSGTTITPLSIKYSDQSVKTINSNNYVDHYSLDSDTTFISTKSKNKVKTITASTLTSKKKIWITGSSTNDTSIVGGKGADTLDGGGKTDDILTGGSGNDLFIINSGNDTITDYTAGKDTIYLDNGVSITGASVSANTNTDIVFTLNNNGTLTVKNAIKKGKTPQKLTITEGSVTTKQTYAQQYLNIANTDGNTVDAGSKINDGIVRTIDASGRSSKYPILLLGSKTTHNQLIGGKGADTINPVGGDRNTLTGGKGNDLFIYSGGYDIITDYSTAKGNSDSINLNGASITSYRTEGKDVIFSAGDSDIIKVEGGKDKYIAFVKDTGSGTTVIDTVVSGVYNEYGTRVFANTDYDNAITFYDASDTVPVNGEASGKYLVDASKRTAKNPIYIKGYTSYSSSFFPTIKGGTGNDTLDYAVGSSSAYVCPYCTLTGGKGKDVFIYRNSQVTITDYTAGQDSIQIARSDYHTYHVIDNDVVLYFDSDTTDNPTLTIKGGRGKKIAATINGKSTVATFNDYEETVLSGTGEATVNGMDSGLTKIVTFNASSRNAKSSINITGNANSNLIKGGSGNDYLDAGSTSSTYKTAGQNVYEELIENTLSGGKGNDTLVAGGVNSTLTGGVGKDIFVFNPNPVGDMHYKSCYITDYTAGQDTIQIGSGLSIDNSGYSYYGYSISDNDIDFTFKDSKTNIYYYLTVANGLGKNIVFTTDGGATIPASQAYSDYTKKVFDKKDTPNAINLDERYYSYIDAGKKSTPITITRSSYYNGTIVGSAKADSIDIGSSTVTGYNRYSVFGGKGNDTLVNHLSGFDLPLVTLNGGAGNDVLSTDRSSVILIGGAGKDTFSINKVSNIVEGASDEIIVTDYTAGQDVIELGSGVSISSVSYVEDSYTDLVFDLTGTEQRLVVKDAIKFKKGTSTPKKITFVTADGTKTSQVYAQSSLTIANGDGDTINLGDSINSGVISASASSRSAKNPIYLVGNSNNNSLIGGKGADSILSGSGSNTITGGKGDDTIQIGNGNNIIKYTIGDGNDVIVNYKSGDKIQLGNAKTKVSNAALIGNDYVLTIGKNKMTLKDISSNTSVAVVDYSGEEKIYTNTSKAAAFIEKSFNELSDDFEDIWFTSIESSSSSIEIDDLIDEFKESNVINYYGENILSIDTNNKSNDELLSFATKKKEK